MRRDRSSACGTEPEQPNSARTGPHLPDPRKRRDGCLPCRSPSGTLVEAYLRNRGITALHETASLRFHPHCYYRAGPAQPDRDLAGDDRRCHRSLRAFHRRPSHLARSSGFSEATLGKAPIDTPRRAKGNLLGNAVRFGVAGDVLAAAKASRRCCRSDAFCLPCQWSQRSRPHISPRFCSRSPCVGSTSPEMMIPLATAQ